MQHAILSVLLAAVLLAPLGASTWSLNGAHEPDTPQDVEGYRMFLDPDTSPGGMRVYFNAMLVDANGLTWMNPNLGALHSRIAPAGRMSATAWLGVWKDCNKDGYVGHVETALMEYRNEILLDKSVCPVGSMWNHHTWVSEFIHIGPEGQPPNSASFPRLITDPEAYVWGDFGRPGNANEIHYDCPQSSFPRGSFDSTGGLIAALDCRLGYNLARSVNDASADLGLPLAFDDPVHPDRDCDHPLNVQLDTYGNSWCDNGDAGTIDGNAGDPAFTVWDCSNGPTDGYAVDVRDPTAPPGQTGALSRVAGFGITDDDGTYGWRPVEGNASNGIYLQVREIAPVSPIVGNPDGSVYEGYQHASDPQCDVGDASNDGLGEGVLGAPPDPATNPTDGKRMADFNMGFNAPCCLGTHQGYPASAGVRGVGSGPWDADAGATYDPPTYLGGTVRTGDLAPAGGLWFTFYARLGPGTFARGVGVPPAGTGYYASETCGSNDGGIHQGWNCDVSLWGGRAVPGLTYHLRDTDCHDGEIVGGTGLRASLADVSPDPGCPYMGEIITPD